MSALPRLLLVPLTILLAVAFFLVATQPMSILAQGALAYGALAALVLLYLFHPKGLFRVLTFLVVLLIVARYIYWRTLYTIPTLDDPVAFTLGLPLYLAELYAVFMLLLNMFVISDPIRRRTPELPPEEELPTVDVFIPTYNEDPDLVAHTVRAAVHMDYPRDRLRVLVLDDGGTTQKLNDSDPEKARAASERAARLRRICETIGAEYYARERNEHAKAGNLNDAFRHTAGDLVVIFDADHIPVASFLRRTVGHFLESEEVYLVQTPHSFLTPDPLERNLGLAGKVPGENEMFYGLVQNGLDRWNASFFCGSAAVLRRTALNEAEGFSGQTVTEDAETAMSLHARGWRSRYVDEPLITGLQPETFSEFIGQRTRWLQGMIQLFLFKNPLLMRGLRIPQRLSYLAIQMFWLFPLPRMVFVIMPPTFLLFGVVTYVASLNEFMVYTVPYLISVITFSHLIFGRLRAPFISDLYETLQAPFLGLALVNVLRHPRSPSFRVTSKGETLDEDNFSPKIIPFSIFPFILIVASLVGLWHYWHTPGSGGSIGIVLGFNTFNLLLAFAAIGVMCERRQLRAQPRLHLERDTTLQLDDDNQTEVQGRIRDISVDGAAVIVHGRLDQVEGRTVNIVADDGTRIPLQAVNYTPASGGTLVNGPVVTTSEAQRVAWSRMIYADSQPIRDYFYSRRRFGSAFVGTLRFIGLALYGLGRVFRILATQLRRNAGRAGSTAHGAAVEEVY